VSTKQLSNLLQIKISIKYIQPSIWRRIFVSDKITLRDLHNVIQAVFSWQDYHLHEFKINHISYGDPGNDDFGDHPLLDEAEYGLYSLGLIKGSRFTYVYDFGDNWEHLLVVEEIIPLEKGTKQLRCIDGKRACPPEDVGGISGYEEFLNILKTPQHEEYESNLVWVGGTFEPNEFDLNMANERIDQFIQKKNEWNPRPEYSLEGQFGWSDPQIMLPNWINQNGSEDREIINRLPLRRDVVSLVTYIKEHKVKGTNSTGNFPRNAVQDIATLLVVPPVMKYEFQDKTIEFKNEWDVRLIYSIHLLAYLAGLIEGSKGQSWSLTSKGEKFLISSSGEQFFILFTTWWFKGDWSDFPVSFQIKDGFEIQFLDVVHSTLLELSPRESTDYSTFVLRMMELTGLKFSTHDFDSGLSRLKSDFEFAIVEPLESFAVLTTERKKNHDMFDYAELSTISLTEIGCKILRSLKKTP
jgi:hypothetical protein